MANLRLRPREWSISTRLAVWYGLTILVLLSFFAAITFAAFRLNRHQDFDRHLTHEQRVLVPLIAFDADGPVITRLDELRSVAYQTDGVYGTFVRLLDAGGAVRYQSPNFETHEPLPVMLPAERVESNISREWLGEPVRSRYLPLADPQSEATGWLEVTGYEWALRQELDQLMRTFAIGIVIGVLLSIIGGYVLARRALDPVSKITSAANGIGSDLAARLPTRFRVRDELTALAETINRLLDRLEDSFHRERRFSSNAAHELVTPLTVMRGELELALRADDADVSREAMRLALADIDRMSGIVRALLELAKAERVGELARTRIDLGTLAAGQAARFEDRAEVQAVNLAVHIVRDVHVDADEVSLGKVVENLLDNALKYTPDGGAVTVTVGPSGSEALLEVTDSGIGFDGADASRLYDRFFRSDQKDVQKRSGSGLGLAIVKTIVEAYGGSVSAESGGIGQGSRFVVRLPRSI